MYQKISVLVLTLAVLALTGGAGLATTIDLRASLGLEGTATAAIGGTFDVVSIPQAPTGTGVFDPFLRLQATGNEQGYNTSLGGANNPLDDKGGIWTHALNLSTVPTVTRDGVAYREFILDINEDSGSNHEWLSLNQIQIFAGADSLNFTVNPTASTTTDPLLLSGDNYSELFRMNDPNLEVAVRNEIQLNYALQSGSGSGDMALYVRDSIFTGLAANANIIFYSQFGEPRGFASSSDGFEEWAVRKNGGGPPQEVPEPATLLLTGAGLVGLAMGIRRKLH